MKKTTIKTFGNKFCTVTLSDEPRIYRCHIGDELVSYTEHLLWVTVRKTYGGVVSEYIVDKYIEDDEDEKESALRAAEIDLNCAMLVYGG